MATFSVLFLVLAVGRLAAATIFRVALEVVDPKAALSPRNDHQEILGASPSPNSQGGSKIPLTRNLTHELLYFTSIAIGTPPQHFQVLLAISSANSFVSSSSCTRCYPGDSKYDSSLSSSFSENGTAINLDFNFVASTGVLAQDTFHIGDLSVSHQLFQEATAVDLIGMSWDDLSVTHGVLGLAPYKSPSSLEVASPFVNMVTQNLLDVNKFSLRLREPRELMFGGINKYLFTGDITNLALTHETGGFFLDGAWQVKAQRVTLGTDPGFTWSLDGYTAAFTTTWAPIGLPPKIAYELVEALGFEDIMFMPMSVPCERRAVMPDVGIVLDGHEFVLSPFDYTYEWPVKGGGVRCVAAFEGHEARDAKEVVLGTSFLRGFYSVFDLDAQTVGFAKLSI